MYDELDWHRMGYKIANLCLKGQLNFLSRPLGSNQMLSALGASIPFDLQDPNLSVEISHTHIELLS